MADNTLAPAALLRLLGMLELGKSVVLETLRGRSVTPEEIAQIRAAMRATQSTLAALDSSRPWSGPWEASVTHGDPRSPEGG